jgi:pyruvoyl-dependent arginine decarboxylase (PvlArgDC)
MINYFTRTLNYAYGDATIDNDNLITASSVRPQRVTYVATYNIRKIDLSRTFRIIQADENEYLVNSS